MDTIRMNSTPARNARCWAKGKFLLLLNNEIKYWCVFLISAWFLGQFWFLLTNELWKELGFRQQGKLKIPRFAQDIRHKPDNRIPFSVCQIWFAMAGFDLGLSRSQGDRVIGARLTLIHSNASLRGTPRRYGRGALHENPTHGCPAKWCGSNEIRLEL